MYAESRPRFKPTQTTAITMASPTAQTGASECDTELSGAFWLVVSLISAALVCNGAMVYVVVDVVVVEFSSSVKLV